MVVNVCGCTCGSGAAIFDCVFTLARSPRSQMTSKNIEIGIIDKATGLFRVLTPDQVADYLEEAD